MTTKTGGKLIKNSSSTIYNSGNTQVGPGSSVMDRKTREDLDKLQQDLNIVVNRLAEAKGEPIPVPTNNAVTSTSDRGSTFVSGLRALAESERKGMKDPKLASLESLLEKITEYDRVVLNLTAPQDVNGLPQRRKSMGADLFSLPTHLRIVDRLIDLHNQSKRVAVVRTTTTINSNSNSTDSNKPALTDEQLAQMDTIRRNAAELSMKLEVSDKKRAFFQDENDKLKASLQELQTKLHETQDQCVKEAAKASKLQLDFDEESKEMKKQINQLTTDLTVAKNEQLKQQNNGNNEELERLRAKVVALNQEVELLQCRLEKEASTSQTILRSILSKAADITNHTEKEVNVNTTGGADRNIDLPAEFSNGLKALDRALDNRIEGMRLDINLLMSVKEVLESELSSANLQKDMMQQDLRSINDEHEALKTAYHSLSYEAATNNKPTAPAKNDAETEEKINFWKVRVEQHASTISRLEGELNTQSKQIRQLEQFPVLVSKLEEQMRATSNDQSRLQAIASASKDEIEHYKKLTETLKQKIRELIAASDKSGKNQDFLDTFEEVMREEMMTMKAAFEGKLRAAREESDAISRRHQQEILKLQSKSPYTSWSTK